MSPFCDQPICGTGRRRPRPRRLPSLKPTRLQIISMSPPPPPQSSSSSSSRPPPWQVLPTATTFLSARPGGGCGSCGGDLPLSYRFIPTESELILHLLNHIWNRPTGVKCIHTASVFYDYSPDQLAAMYGESDVGIWYFFTPIPWTHASGNHVRRAAGDGHWKRVGSRQPVVEKTDNTQIGTRQYFDFYRGEPSAGRNRGASLTTWTMHEYRVSSCVRRRYLPYGSEGPAGVDEKMAAEWVLCSVYERELRDDDSTSSRSQGRDGPLDLLCNKLRGRNKRSWLQQGATCEGMESSSSPVLTEMRQQGLEDGDGRRSRRGAGNMNPPARRRLDLPGDGDGDVQRDVCLEATRTSHGHELAAGTPPPPIYDVDREMWVDDDPPSTDVDDRQGLALPNSSTPPALPGIHIDPRSACVHPGLGHLNNLAAAPPPILDVVDDCEMWVDDGVGSDSDPAAVALLTTYASPAGEVRNSRSSTTTGGAASDDQEDCYYSISGWGEALADGANWLPAVPPPDQIYNDVTTTLAGAWFQDDEHEQTWAPGNSCLDGMFPTAAEVDAMISEMFCDYTQPPPGHANYEAMFTWANSASGSLPAVDP